jgi:Anti-sigma factor NepR
VWAYEAGNAKLENWLHTFKNYFLLTRNLTSHSGIGKVLRQSIACSRGGQEVGLGRQGRYFMAETSDKKGKAKVKHAMINRPDLMATSGGHPPVYDIIAARLRDYYDEVAKQPVPGRFVELLNQLEAKAKKKDN